LQEHKRKILESNPKLFVSAQIFKLLHFAKKMSFHNISDFWILVMHDAKIIKFSYLT